VAGLFDRFFGGPAPGGPPASPPPPDEPAEATGAPGQRDEITELAGRLTTLVRKVNRNGGKMPEGGVPGVRAIEDVLRPLLTYLAANPPTEEELIPVRATLTDYLPTTLDTFLALPKDFAHSHRNRSGRTPATELVEQLHLLHAGVVEYAQSIYAGDAQELSNQGRFLQTKFGRTDLTL
jgi:hypothetical protein